MSAKKSHLHLNWKPIASALLLISSLTAPTFSVAADAIEPHTLRIGYQKYGSFIVLKQRGNLEQRLAPLNVKVEWTEFTAGPQMLEGLNVGSIDLAVAGETPPVIAQAAQADLLYVGHEPAAPKAEAILVPKNSPIKTLEDLKGKRIATNKGSNSHYLIVKALEKAGVKYNETEVVYLPPADARAAFEKGSLDAWAVWDPFYAAAVANADARVLTDGEGIVKNYNFYLASGKYAKKHSATLKVFLEELAELDKWADNNRRGVAEILAPQVGLDVDVVETAIKRSTYRLTNLSDDVIANQQAIADTFFELKLIPKKLNVTEIVWKQP